MKTFATMTAAAALIAGMSIAHAQTAPTQGSQPSPSNLNAVPNDDGRAKSGAQTPGTAMQKGTSTMDRTNPNSGAASASQSPADPNARPIQSGDAKQSGTQSKESQMKSGGAKPVMPSATTGSGSQSPADPTATPGLPGKN